MPEIQEIVDHFNAIRAVIRRSGQADLASSGLTLQQANAIEVLSREDGLTLTQLSQRMALAHSTVSGIVDRLAKKNLLHRRSDSNDRRRARIYLDENVTAYINYHIPSRRTNWMVGALSHAAPAERQLIREGLATLHRLMEMEMKAESAS